MRCSKARLLIFELELGRLPASAGQLLASHLEACPTCAGQAALERTLTADLAALRVEAPFEIDVVARVVTQLDELDDRPHLDVSATQIGLAATLAAVGSLAVLAGLWSSLPRLWSAARDGWTLAGGLRQFVASLGGAAVAVLSAAARALRAVAEPLVPLLSPLQGLEPAAIAALAFGAVVMATTIVLVVGRDFRARPLHESRG